MIFFLEPNSIRQNSLHWLGQPSVKLPVNIALFICNVDAAQYLLVSLLVRARIFISLILPSHRFSDRVLDNSSPLSRHGTVHWIYFVKNEETMSIFCRDRPLLGPPPLRRRQRNEVHRRGHRKDGIQTTNGLIQPWLAIKSNSIYWFGGVRWSACRPSAWRRIRRAEDSSASLSRGGTRSLGGGSLSKCFTWHWRWSGWHKIGNWYR